MNIYVDIDETICFYEGERHYPLAIPNKENISYTMKDTILNIGQLEEQLQK